MSAKIISTAVNIEMEDFLKKFSSVPSGFIKDFFNIAKEEYNDNEHKINLNTVVKWLSVIKVNLKRLLVSKFENKYDYLITKEKVMNKNNQGANYIENIMITPNCFKELCMISQTPKAKEVRKYFLEVERLIKKYNEDIKFALLKQIGLLKTNQKPKVDVGGGMVYILLAMNTDVTAYKIGRSDGLKERLSTYNSGNANDVEPLFMMRVKDLHQVEGCLKNILKKYQYRKRKEIYEIDLDVLKELMTGCDEFTDSMSRKIGSMTKAKAKRDIGRLKTTENPIFMALYPDAVVA
jgi:phage anti-repressor protein